MTVLSPKAQETLRAAAAKKLQELTHEAETSDAPSWVLGPTTSNGDKESANRSAQCRFFDHAGFLKLHSFVDAETTCRKMKEEMAALVESEWHPERDGLDSFGTDSEQNIRRGDYFLESADAVHFFAEPGALLSSSEPPQLKPEYYCSGDDRPSKLFTALNKAGHAMHTRPHSVFRDYCRDPRLLALLLDLGWRDPVVPQSMYIFKQAGTGGAVHSHQDSTFLFTTPRQTCIGLWLALDEATLENGCLWVRPGSHRSPEYTRRHYQRNVRHFGAAAIAKRSNDGQGDTAGQPKFVMRDLPPPPRSDDNNDVPWDGALPGDGSSEALLDAGFIPIECQAGDLLAFNGELDHLSLPNHSDRARHTFQLHCVEGPSQGVTWSEYNWLQYPDGKPFVRLRSEGEDDV